MDIIYSSKFQKSFRKLDAKLKKQSVNKIKLFQKNPANPVLKTHKLYGILDGLWAFRINYEYRILFVFEKDGSVTFLNIGTHSIYE